MLAPRRLRSAGLPTLLALAAGLAAMARYNRTRSRRASSMQSRDSFVLVHGVRLHYLRRGRGLPLVLLHGNGSTAEDFEASGIIERSKESFDVIAFDRPGFGRTLRSDRNWTPSAQADLFAAALKQMGVDRYVVLGHSWGTLVALQLALRYARDVAGLVLLSGYYYPKVRPAIVFGAAPALPVAGTVLRNTLLPPLVRIAWPVFLRIAFGPTKAPAAFRTRMKHLASRPSQLAAVAAEAAFLLSEAMVRRDYGSVAVPTAILAGLEDNLIDAQRQAAALHQVIPASFMETLPAAGHMLHHSAPDEVRRVIGIVASLVARSPS